MTAEIAQLKIMTAQEYAQERAKISLIHGDSSREAGAKRDQALATLFWRSGWTQERLATQEGKKQPYISQRLVFGRFLNFIATRNNFTALPSTLTENLFRTSYWAKTNKADDERTRFRLAHDLILAAPPPRPQIGNQIIAGFGDGNWHAAEKIAATLDVEVDHVEATFKGMLGKGGSYKSGCESKRDGGKTLYRIFPLGHSINSNEMVAKLSPIAEALKVQGKKSMATMSPDTVADLARELQKLIDVWARSEGAKDSAPLTIHKSPKGRNND